MPQCQGKPHKTNKPWTILYQTALLRAIRTHDDEDMNIQGPLLLLGMTATTGVITWVSALVFGLTASDGNVTAQTVRLLMIAVAAIIAVAASALRERRERQLLVAEQQAAAAEQLREQAMHDVLTGLLNRRGALATLESRSGGPFVLAVIDCDEFKDVNDAYGHPVGDTYLAALAGRLRGAVASSDIVARWGGDEFLIVVNGEPAAGRSVIDRVIATVTAEPIAVGAVSIDVSLSFGTATLASPADLNRALTNADTELYAAKRQRRES